jgi:hypothetical protein
MARKVPDSLTHSDKSLFEFLSTEFSPLQSGDDLRFAVVSNENFLGSFELESSEFLWSPGVLLGERDRWELGKLPLLLARRLRGVSGRGPFYTKIFPFKMPNISSMISS